MLKGKYQLTKAAKIVLIQLAICSIGLMSGFTWEVYNQNQKWDKLVYPGIKITGIDLSGKTRDEGISSIKSDYLDVLTDRGVNVIINGKTYAMDCSRLILDYDIQSSVDEAIAAGKSLSFFNKYKIIKEGISNRYNIYFTYNNSYLKEFISQIEKDVNREPTNAKVNITPEGNIKIVDDIRGCKLNALKLEEYIKENIEYGFKGDIILEAPVEEVAASITADTLNPIDMKLASFSTSFASSSASRAHNIELAAKAINGSLLMPGDVFSFNDYVGERTKDRGFMAAPVLEDGNYKPGVGGGICQVSTTLYKAALDSGIKIIERKSHGLPSSYIALGLDATVSWGNIDLKFQNTFEYPIFIEAYIKDKNVHINMYSNSSLSDRTYNIKNNVYMKISPKTEIIEDLDLTPDKTVVVRKGSNGYKVRVTRDTYEKDELVDSEVISDDYYRPVNGIIRKGMANNETYL